MPFAIPKQGCSAFIAAGLAIAAALAAPAQATVIVGSPSLPLLGIPYISPTGPGCFNGAGVCVTPGRFILTSTVSSVFIASGQDIVANADAVDMVTTLEGTFIGTVTLTGTVDELVEGRTSDSQTGSWVTELTGLSLTGSVLGGALTATLGSDPSTGMTSIEPIGQHGFRIDSFFDVFVDLSLSTGLSTSVGPIFVTIVPEPSTWALMLIGFAGLGFAARRGAAMLSPPRMRGSRPPQRSL